MKFIAINDGYCTGWKRQQNNVSNIKNGLFRKEKRRRNNDQITKKINDSKISVCWLEVVEENEILLHDCTSIEQNVRTMAIG